MNFINKDTGEIIHFSTYDDENQNILMLLLAGKTVQHENKLYKLSNQDVFCVQSSVAEIELIELDKE